MEIDEMVTNPAADNRSNAFLEPIPQRNAVPEDVLRARRMLKDIRMKPIKDSLFSMPDLLSFMKHNNPIVVKQSISTGTSLFCAVLTEMAHQVFKTSEVEGWLIEMWSWMLQFKEAVFGIMSEPGFLGAKLLAAKFLETCFLLFTADVNDNDTPIAGAKGRNFSISWFQGQSVLNQRQVEYETNKILDLLTNVVQSARSLAGSLVIASINCLASIAKKRPAFYESILSVLLGFESNFDSTLGASAASVRYSVRTALIGFLRCSHPRIIESRDELLRILRAMNLGDVTDQIIRQFEKTRSNERNFRDMRANKDDSQSGQVPLSRARPVSYTSDTPAVSDEMPAKRVRFNSGITTNQSGLSSELQNANVCVSNSSAASIMNSNEAAVEKIIRTIGALLAAGDMGRKSIDLLVTNTQPELMADIVIETLKNLPKNMNDILGRNGSTGFNSRAYSQTGSSVPATASTQVSALSSERPSTSLNSSGISTGPPPDHMTSDVKRDPRRDPRRLDPRIAVPAVVPNSLLPNMDSVDGVLQPGSFQSSSKPVIEIIKVEKPADFSEPKTEVEVSESTINPPTDLMNLEETSEMESNIKMEPLLEETVPSISLRSPVGEAKNDFSILPDFVDEDTDDSMQEDEHYSSPDLTPSTEETCHELPLLPPFVKLTNEQKKTLYKFTITRIIEDSKKIQATGCDHSRLSVLARLLAQTDMNNDIIMYFQQHIISDYHHNKGHDLAMHVLFQLHFVMNSDVEEHSTVATKNYENFLLAVAKILLESLPASDKAFSRVLGEAPFLPESALKLLGDVCQSCIYNDLKKDIYDGDRVTQGLGALWSVILGRPLYRQACLDIALKCSVQAHDEVRAKAIRLVANKLLPLNYASETVEQFARNMLLSVVNQQVPEAELKLSSPSDQQTETGSQETSISGSQSSELGASESVSAKGVQASLGSVPAATFHHAEQHTSLFFALCTKKPNLLRFVFEIYEQAPKAVKESIHHHVPTLVRTLGSRNSELLDIMANSPEGSKSLIMLVLETMTEESMPSVELIAAVKHLYSTKLKDVTILIPMLSSFSKDEVLAIFARLVDLPLEKFQTALARILQGTANTGPALTPVEVLIAIHDVNPGKDGVALKKIMDACTACFEQRTVFTQHVLAKSLSHMVEQVPLPLLFMRTLIQAIDAFPQLVDFVMGILDKLVTKEIWKMPKLWVGFLKLASQTQPHSFDVLLKLPPPQLEGALGKYVTLRAPLAAYANQPNIRNSLSRQTLRALGLDETAQADPRSFPAPGNSSSSVHGTSFT